MVALSGFATLDEIDVFVTDSALNAQARAALTETVGELVVAPVAGA